MTQTEFDALQRDLEDELAVCLTAFFNRRGLAYDHAAYIAQRDGSYEHSVREVLYLGADLFPFTPEGGEEVETFVPSPRPNHELEAA